MSHVLPEPIQFGRYTLYERIGRGGMADVFRARIRGPAGFERVFVVKRILPQLSGDPTFIGMLIQEAKLSARLIHENIVQIFELGDVDGEYFISMEHVAGHDLARTMRGMWKQLGAPAAELVAFIGREMCQGLAYAHDLLDEKGQPQGMIHRDVSPPNVMLAFDGAVKLVDFGIAKALGDAPEITQNGTVKGKYAYMAPEQTYPGDVDHRVDIFATGVVLHEVLTGRRLFKGGSDFETVERVRRCEVRPPSEVNAACPRVLDEIVLRALARDPAERFQTADEMAEALDQLVHAAHFTKQHLGSVVRTIFAGEAGTLSVADRRLPALSTTSSSSSISLMDSHHGTTTIPPVQVGGTPDPTARSRATALERGAAPPAPVAPRRGLRRASWAVIATCAGVVGVAVVAGVGGGHQGITRIEALPVTAQQPLAGARPSAPVPTPPPEIPAVAAAPTAAADRAVPPQDLTATAPAGPNAIAAVAAEIVGDKAAVLDHTSRKGQAQRNVRKSASRDRSTEALAVSRGTGGAKAEAPHTAPPAAEEAPRAKPAHREIVNPFVTDPTVVNPF